jgi:hypothetical protein
MRLVKASRHSETLNIFGKSRLFTRAHTADAVGGSMVL